MSSGLPQSRFILVALAVSLLVGGCAAGTPSASVETPAAPSTVVSATPEPTRAAGGIVWPVITERPASQIPFTCEEMLPRSLFTGSTTSGMTLDPDQFWNIPFYAAVREQQGALACVWQGDVTSNTRIELTVRRHATAFDRISDHQLSDEGEENTLGGEKSYLDCGEDYGPIYCSFEAVAGDYWMYGNFSSDVVAPAPSAGQQLVYRFAHSAATVMAAAPESPLWAAPAGSWPLQVDCDAVEAGGSVASMLGPARHTVTDHYEAPVTAANSIGGISDCWWLYEDEIADGVVRELNVSTLAGGGWFWGLDDPTTPETVNEVVVSGADNARVRCAKSRCSLEVQLGSNAFLMQGYMANTKGSTLKASQLAAIAPNVILGLRAWMNEALH